MAFIATAGRRPRQIWELLIATSLPKLWIPKPDDIWMVEKLPMLGTGKVDLRAIKHLALQHAAGMHSRLQLLAQASHPQASVIAWPQVRA